LLQVINTIDPIYSCAVMVQSNRP